MAVVYLILFIVMLLFAGVQYNDPDGLFWMVVYAVPACWCAMSYFKPHWYQRSNWRFAMLGSQMAALSGVIYFWPRVPGFWRKDVWYVVETAREGLGLMIVLAVLIICYAGARWRDSQSVLHGR